MTAPAGAARSAKRTMGVVRELRCGDRETTSRKHGVTGATLSPVARGLPAAGEEGARNSAAGSGRRAARPLGASQRPSCNGERAAARAHPAHGGGDAKFREVVEAMSRARSVSICTLLRAPAGYSRPGAGRVRSSTSGAAGMPRLALSPRPARPEAARHRWKAPRGDPPHASGLSLPRRGPLQRGGAAAAGRRSRLLAARAAPDAPAPAAGAAVPAPAR